MSEADLEQILAAARTHNEADGITGVLVYTEGFFLQILEGTKDAVEQCLARIGDDPRHEGMTTFGAIEVGAREFENWRMAYLNPTPEELSQWIGLEAAETKESLLTYLERNPKHMPQFLNRLVEVLA